MRPNERIDSIQLLRAMAALAVVTHHIPLFNNGMWGVDLFFVISGYIICYVTAKSGKHFLTKRIIRVVPLYWTATFCLFLVALILPILVNSTEANLTDLLKSLFFIPYQKGAFIQPVLGAGWTLNFEMFFYLIFAISMAISHRHRALICSGLFVGIATLGQLVKIDNVPYRFYTDAIILEFVYGMFCYFLIERMIRNRSGSIKIRWQVRTLLVLLGLTLFLLGSQTLPLIPEWNRAFVWGIPSAISFLCVCLGLHCINLPRPITLIGDASYSLYLSNPFVTRIFERIFHAFSLSGIWAYFMALLAIVLCCLVAIASYFIIEKTSIRILRSIFIPKQTVKTVAEHALPANPPAVSTNART